MASNNFPAGVRFVPTDEELIVDYLLKKIHSQPIPLHGIADVNLYHYNPHTLTEKYPPLGEREWYFFTPLEKKYPNGLRPKRAADSGYWKATGSDRRILFQNQLVGFKRSLVFYEGEQKNGKKTNWVMHEYKADQPPRTKTSASDMRLEDWVLCRIYKKESKARDDRKGKKGNEEVVDDQNQVNEEVGDNTDYGNQGCIVETHTITPLVDEKVEHCSYGELLHDGLTSDPLPPIWLREMSPKINFDDDYDPFLAIDAWPEFFTDGNNATCSCASSQVSSIVPPTASEANFVVNSNLVREEDADDDCDL